MNEFDKISDEQLACFIEGNLCGEDCDGILDAVASHSDMDTLSIAYQASKLVDCNDAATPSRIIDLQYPNNDLDIACIPMPNHIETSALGDSYMASMECSDVAEDPFRGKICACRSIPDESDECEEDI